MDKDKLSPREEALLAEARREAASRKAAPTARAPAAPAEPRAEPRAASTATPTAAERLERLMDEERAQTAERKRKMRRKGLWISGSILALFVLWLLSALRRRR